MNPGDLLTSIPVAFAAFLSTLAGGAVVAHSHGKPWFHRITAFAAGVLIAVPLLELLPEALALALERGFPVVWVMHSAALGFLFLMVIDRYMAVRRECEGGVCRTVRHLHGGTLGASELVAHSFLDGVAIGLGFQAGPEVGFIIASAVIAHDFSDGMNTVTLMLRSGHSLYMARAMLVADAVAPVAGAISALLFAIPQEILASLLAFFAGGFLYLGASNLLPDSYEHNPPLVALLLNLAGFGVILLIARLLEIGE